MTTTEVLVIGGGPGGYVAAIRAAQLGKKVTLVEAEAVGGVCLNVGCIPSKALITAGHRYQEMQHSDFLGLTAKEVVLDFAKTQQWKKTEVIQPLTTGIASLLKKNQVALIKGQASFISKNEVAIVSQAGTQRLTFMQGIIATGSRPIAIPGFPFGGRILDSTGGLNLAEVPKRLVVIGGGYIGCELAGAYANLGSTVTIIEGSSSILPTFEADIQQLITKAFQRKGVTIVTAGKAMEAKQTHDQVQIEVQMGTEKQLLVADYVLVTVGRQPNTDILGLEAIGIQLNQQGLIPVDQQYRTVQPHLFAIGDVIEGPALAHKASYDGKVAAEVCSGKNVMKDYRAIPAICFTDPEIATVGLTKAEALAKGIVVGTAMFPLQGNGRGRSLHETDGFVRLVFRQADQTLLGAQIVGVNASELIAEVTVAIESFLTLADIALTIHGHPTLSEMIMEASEMGLGSPIHQ